jgi:hypothetical protein
MTGMEDLEDVMDLAEKGVEAELAGVVVQGRVGTEEGTGEREGEGGDGVSQPGMKLMMGTEFEGSARQILLVDDDD